MGDHATDGAAALAAADGPDADSRHAELDLVRVRHARRLLAADARARQGGGDADHVDQRQGLRDLSGGGGGRARRQLGIHGPQLRADADPADRGSARGDAPIDRYDRKFTGKKPTGWLGPGRGQTHDTLDYATECGFTWFGDWVLDDQPFWVKTANGPILAVPYSAEINTLTLMVPHHPE